MTRRRWLPPVVGYVTRQRPRRVSRFGEVEHHFVERPDGLYERVDHYDEVRVPIIRLPCGHTSAEDEIEMHEAPELQGASPLSGFIAICPSCGETCELTSEAELRFEETLRRCKTTGWV